MSFAYSGESAEGNPIGMRDAWVGILSFIGFDNSDDINSVDDEDDNECYSNINYFFFVISLTFLSDENDFIAIYC